MAQALRIVLAIGLLCSIVSAQNRNSFMMKAALKGDQFMQNMPMNQMIQQRNLQPQTRTNTFGRVNTVMPQQQQQQITQTLLPPSTSQVNPSQQIISQIEQIMKNHNKVPAETSTKKSLPLVQSVAQSKDNNFKTQTRPQLQPSPQSGGPTTIQKPQFERNQQTTQSVTPRPANAPSQQQTHTDPVVSNIKAGQQLSTQKRQEDLETTTFVAQQHLDSFHESSDELKKQSIQIEQLLEQEKQRKLQEERQKQQEQQQKQQEQMNQQKQLEEQQKQQEQLSQQNQAINNQQKTQDTLSSSSSSETDAFLTYPRDYYKKYLDYEPCMSSPCPFGKKCVNKSVSRGYECLAPEPSPVATRQLSGTLRKLNNRYQSNELLLALRKRKKLEDSLF